MAYTNVHILSEYNIKTKYQIEIAALRSELDVYKKLYRAAIEKLENIPIAIIEFGYVDISINDEPWLRLVKDKGPCGTT